MTSIINEFKVFNSCEENIRQKIKLFHVFESDFAICVTNDDKVYAFGEKDLFGKYLGYEEKYIDNNYVLINELCEVNIEKFFCFKYTIDFCLFAKSSDNTIFSSGGNKYGQLARRYKSDEYLKPKRIEYFDDKDIIDISLGSYCHCLALSSEGLVYGWGDNSKQQFDKSGDLQRFLSPILINSEFGVKKRVKHIHCFNNTSILVTFDGFVYVLNSKEWHLTHEISELSACQQNIL